MFELGRILVVIDPEAQQQPALERALGLARLADVELELFVADFSTYLEDGYYFDPLRARELRQEHGEHQLQQLEALAKPLRESGVEVSCSVAWGNPPYEEIIRRVRELHPDLVIKATRHHARLTQLLLGNDDWELIRYCPVPLLLARGKDWAKAPVFLAAVDPEHSHDKPAALDDKIVATARALSAACEGAVHLFHSTHLPPLSGLYPIHSDYQVDVAKVEALAGKFSLPKNVCHVTDEEIQTGLPALALGLDAAAVVMGAVSRSRLDRMLIGNTAERVLDELDCDALIVKPDSAEPMKKLLL